MPFDLPFVAGMIEYIIKLSTNIALIQSDSTYMRLLYNAIQNCFADSHKMAEAAREHNLSKKLSTTLA
jgi:hypothetical protein